MEREKRKGGGRERKGRGRGREGGKEGRDGSEGGEAGKGEKGSDGEGKREKDMFKSCPKLYMYIRLTAELSISIANS